MIPLILGLFGALYYLGHSEVRHFENIAAKDIRSKIHGEHAKVSVKVELNGIIGGPLGDLRKATIRASDFETEGVPLFTEPELSKKGLIRDFHIELREFVLSGLRVQELLSDIPDCHFDYGLAVSKKKIRLSASGVGHGEVVIREKDLEAYILRKFKEIKKVSVRVTRGRVLVEGYGEFLIIKTNFLVDAKLIAVDGTKLMLDEATILFDGKPADELAKKTLLDVLNPVVDLNKDLKLYDAVRVEKIVLQDGVIRASGATKIPVKPVSSLEFGVWSFPVPSFEGGPGWLVG
jgi:hypothetical protein